MNKGLKNLILVSSFIISFYSCKEGEINWRNHWESPKIKNKLLADPTIHKRIKESLIDTSIVVLTSTFIVDTDRFTKVKSLGDINNNFINDSIMVIPELFITEEGSYENGASIIFTDASIPRIRVDVPCLDVDFIFTVDDINEDGIKELGKYSTSCASRFKGLQLITIKDEKWIIDNQVIFDVLFEEPHFSKRIEKTGLNTYKMREISLETVDTKYDIWKEFTLD